MTPRIAPLIAADVPTLVDHFARHGRESGRDGDPIFIPRSADSPQDPTLAERLAARIARAVGEPGWFRSWGLWSGDALVGHVDLSGGELASSQHRATIAIGLERPARGQGRGRRLMDTAIAFARAEGLAWLDLYVFAHNAPALALYQALGFEAVGVTRDRFRVDGQPIDDVAMALRLR